MADRTYEDHMRERFTLDVAEHTLTVLHDQDGYLHLRFRKPGGTSMYWFDIVCWPGTLAVRGDMGSFMFTRIHDMMSFFRGHAVNPQYWAEKEVTGAPTKRFDPDTATRVIEDEVKDRRDEYSPEDYHLIVQAATAMVRSEDWSYREGVQMILNDFSVALHDGSTFRFHDTWEWDLEEWTAQYLWCCFALPWAIAQYDATKVDK